MAKSVSLENRDKFIQLGISIATLRKIRGLTQADLAALVGVSRDTIQRIETPGVLRSFSFETFLKIAYALDVEPAELLRASVFSDGVLRGKA